MKNKITDLNNHLFAQLEKLNDEQLSKEDLQTEIDRAKAMSNIGAQIIETQKLSLDVIKEAYKQGYGMETTAAGKLLLDKGETNLK